jgi:hypothetical protein
VQSSPAIRRILSVRESGLRGVGAPVGGFATVQHQAGQLPSPASTQGRMAGVMVSEHRVPGSRTKSAYYVLSQTVA